MTTRLISLMLASVGAMAVIAAAPAASAILVANGGFQSGVVGAGSFEQVDAGDSTTITGWTVGPGNVDWIHGYWEGSSGLTSDYSVDLSGSEHGTIWQTITGLISGQLYNLTFDLATNFDGPVPQSLNFSLGTIATGIVGSASTSANPNAGWDSFNFSFTWLGAGNTALLLFATDNPDGICCFGPALDSVALNAVPLPAALPLLAAGLGTMGYFGSRRRRKAALAA
jgi:choice-of-anchor C domain-containing protein